MSQRMFAKVLIANRGEIACRVMRTCRRMSISTVAVYSDADAHALHVRTADQAVALHGSTAKESYLDAEKILAAARRTGAEAIHPGYGFLSENDAFADACTAAGITFIGPPAGAIRAMGSKSAAKALMEKAGVPLTPGYHGAEQAPEFLRDQADSIGYPVLIKASAGGGGKGMRQVNAREEFVAALAACKREAAASFGDDRVLIERYILQPRHIEIQVFADTFGQTVSLFERDCSVQRRHQKVLEEAPAPGMTEDRRTTMGKAACDAARAVGYVGAGTVEFIADAQGGFHFMEMNTRLQVEHPVTEMITGLDLVEWQLRVAAGEPLPCAQEELRIRGHALEARIYAEDPTEDFRPSTGRLRHLKLPSASRHVRVDTGVEQGDEITAFYDPMVAKLIVWAENRELALEQMQRALTETQIVGVSSNVAFLRSLVASPSFAEARLDTGLIERERSWLMSSRETAQPEAMLFAVLAQISPDPECEAAGVESPWARIDGWRLNNYLHREFQYKVGTDSKTVLVEWRPGALLIQLDGRTFHVAAVKRHHDEIIAIIDDVRQRATVVALGTMQQVFWNGHTIHFEWIDPLAHQVADEGSESSLLSPIPGILKALLVNAGELVEKGTPLLVLEAMKMEMTVVAPAAGRVTSFFFAAGEQVPEAVQLLEFERTQTAER